MHTDKKLNLKISAETFEIKNLEIKDGRLELLLSANIADTRIASSEFDYSPPAMDKSSQDITVTETAEPDNVDVVESTSSAQAEEVTFTAPLSNASISKPTADIESPRYGEPVPDVEWQAVNTDIYSTDPEDEEYQEYIAQEPEFTPDINSVNMQDTPEEEQTLSENKSDTEKVKSLTDDILPDYLKQVEPPKNISVDKQSNSPSVFDQMKSQDDTPTVVFEREHIEELQTDPDDTPASDDTPESSAGQSAPEREAIPDSPAPEHTAESSVKIVKFLCPRCHTPGSQPISNIGNIITCANCGRALKLNIKR